jgi:nucleotide-binding universal stress UspA family protein
MKKLLLLTDFSVSAMHAAEYAHNLACQIRADIVLCNIVNVPANDILAATVWPVYDYNVLMEESAGDLKRLSTHLKNQNKNAAFKPKISAINKDGLIADTVIELADQLDINMVVMGTHTDNGLKTFIMGDHAKDMIDATNKPLLLVPQGADISTIKKIAFATDFKQPEDDLATIYHLIRFAKLMNAEILIVHTHDEKQTNYTFKTWLDNLLIELSNKADYPNIYYRLVKSRDPESGLDWLCEHGQVDMLAVLHRTHNFFENLFKGSYTKKLAGNINVPLLVFPEK